MRIAIITQFGDNYGNKLQNYAMQAWLENMGYNAETIIIHEGVKLHHSETLRSSFIKLNPSYLSEVASSRIKNHYGYKNQRDGIPRVLLNKNESDLDELKLIQRQRFQLFTDKYIRIAPNEFIPGQYHYSDEYDAYVCGADQIWNPNYVCGGYFAYFAPEHKRIAYAPSFGLNHIPKEYHSLYKEWLNGIPYLSVREERGAEIIKELTGRDVPVLPDPTLCLSKEQWENIEKKPDYIKDEPFVLTYFLGNETNKYRQFIERYAGETKIVNLYDMREPEFYSTDPAEFVWLIHHAKAMFTDSFHGTVFSLIFHTPFLVFDRIESGGTCMSSRIETLLKMAGMEDRSFGNSNDIDACDFSEIDSIIEKQKKRALMFLQSSLKGVEGAKPMPTVNPYVLERNPDCSGCAACAAVCPIHCIKMKVDTEGFRYPSVDYDNCIHCDKCRNLCSKSQKGIPQGVNKAYIAWSENEKIRRRSSSGGMFSELAKRILKQGGYVYGVGFDDHFKVVHKSIEKIPDLKQVCGSKYVQSEVDSCFEDIKSKLQKGKKIYFSGTPCQVDGLLSYLGKEYENLYTQDIICHGVPSPEVWKAYLSVMSKGKKITNVSFRDKTYGWRFFSMRIDTENKKYIKRLEEDVYTRLFLENVILRPSCYNCHHKHLYRKADITLADCWSLNKFGADVADDDKGFSLVFANTEKGKKLLEKSSAKTIEVPFDTAAKSQDAMTNSVKYNQNRELFFSMAEEQGFEEVLRKWYGWDEPLVIKRKMNYFKYKIKKRITHL